MKLASFIALTAAAALAPAQTLLVLNKEGTLAIVDPASKKILGKVPVGDQPHEVDVSADGKLAFVTNYGTGPAGNTLSVVDLAARKELHRVDISPLTRPHGIWAVGNKAYFTAEANKIVARYDAATNKVDMLLGTGQNATHMVLALKDESKLFTANIGSDSITIAERSGGGAWNTTVVPVGMGPEGFDISPDGKQLWAANSRDGSISIIDLATKKVVNRFDIQTKRSNRLKFSPDGRLVLVSDLEVGELVILEHATRKDLKRIKLGRGLAGILITPDSARAYCAATGDNNVAVVDLKTLELVDRLQTGTGPDGMAWIK
jgi:DNA-binding beta-propeller fold protein YncE